MDLHDLAYTCFGFSFSLNLLTVIYYSVNIFTRYQIVVFIAKKKGNTDDK